jgi:S-adenosylhomocysteine hydrolase
MKTVRPRPAVVPPAPSRPTAPTQARGLPLDAILNVLDSGLADELVRDVATRAMHQLLDDKPTAPADAFEAEVARHLAHNTGAAAKSTPRAMVQSLATVTGPDGVVDADIAGKLLGPSASAVLLRVQQLIDARGSVPGVSRPTVKYDGLDPSTTRTLARSHPHPTFIERMPAINAVRLAVGADDLLAGFSIASIQHLLPSTRALYDALVACGAQPGDVYVGGKSYSTHPDVVARMEHDGYLVHDNAKPHPPVVGEDVEEVLTRMAKDQLTAMFKGVNPNERNRRFLLLDDGAQLVKVLHRSFPQYAHLCVAVEQTDRGVQVLEKMVHEEGLALNCPVINVARSTAKKQTENVLIGESIAFHADHHLASISPALAITPKIACLIGYGAVGKATAAALMKRGYQVVVTDTDPARRAAAQKDGCTPLPRTEALAQAHLLVSATGRTTITPAEYDLLPDHAVLLNAASGNHELGLHTLTSDQLHAHEGESHQDERSVRGTFNGQPVWLGDRTDDPALRHRVWHTDGGKELLLLRSGYVANMALGLPPEMVQSTLGLLLGACLQGAREPGAGLVPLSPKVQRVVLESTTQSLAKAKLSLTEPDFSAIPSWQV